MKCKKELMGISALLILIFHLYIPFTARPLEITIQKAAFVGVDLFFFLSAYSLGRREKIVWKDFWKNRLSRIYLPFIIFTIFAFLYQKWEAVRIVKVIFGVELFQRGGGAFLWFIPGIMVFYFFAPLWITIKEKLGKKGLALMLVMWLLLAVVVQFVLKQNQLMIMVHRMPIFFFGLFYEELKEALPRKVHMPLLCIMAIVGGILLYQYGGIVKINKPFYDFFYIVAIPFELAVVGWVDCLTENRKEKVGFWGSVLGFVGGFTLELYALQMIIGYNLEERLFAWRQNGQVAFAFTCIILMVLSYGLCCIKKWIITLWDERKRNE